MVMPLAAERLIRGPGWRSAYLALGLAAVAITTPLALFVVRESPAGYTPPAHVRKGARGPMRSSVFLRLLLVFFLLSLGANGCVAHLPALLTDTGFGTQAAALAMALLGGASLGGRLLTGVLLDRFFAPRVGFAFLAASAGAMLLLLTASFPAALVAAALLGSAIGAEADLMPYLLGRYFGLQRFGELYGYAFSAYAVAGGAGPFFMGWLFDAAGSYLPAVLLFAVLTAVAAAILLRLPAYGAEGA
jgi:predicted MFS family arabinose efflux permease